MFLDKIPVRIRLSLGHAIWMGVLFVAVGLGLYKTVENQLLEAIDSSILTTARFDAAVLSTSANSRFKQNPRSTRNELFFKRLPNGEISLYQMLGKSNTSPYSQIIEVSGKIQSKSGFQNIQLPVTPRAVSRAERGYITFENFPDRGRPTLRQVTIPVMRNGKFTGQLAQAGAPLDDTYGTLDQIFYIIWIALTIGLTLSIVFGYILSGSAFKPVRNISNTASKLAIDDLSIRLPLPKANDELREISITFNAMLDRLEESVKRLRRFTGDVSHELRTPLAVMRGEAELALRRFREPESYQETLRTISTEAVHMTGIIEDLLLLARAESKNVALNPEEINVADFAKELEFISQSVFTEKSVNLVCKIEDNIEFSASRKLLSLAIKNILVNAAKHSPKNSDVEFRIYKILNDIHFEVSDKGEGIPEESIPYIFESFYRADTARNRGAGGVGIGLSLALALIKLHNGDIKVQSVVGEGSKFTLHIPIKFDFSKIDLTNKKKNLSLNKLTQPAIV